MKFGRPNPWPFAHNSGHNPLILGGGPKIIQLMGGRQPVPGFPVTQWLSLEELQANEQLQDEFDNMSTEPGRDPGDWIVGASGTRYYAQRQPHTAAEIWNFCWEQNIANIVNVRGEGCVPYWQEGIELLSEENIVCEEAIFSYITKRTLRLTRGEESKEVVQWHVRYWPDGQPPEHGALVTLLEELDGETGNMVVHCMQGQGRTGTFMLAREVRHQILKEEVRLVDVLGILRGFRQKRYLIHNYMQLMAAFEVGRHYAGGEDPCGMGLTERTWKSDLAWERFGRFGVDVPGDFGHGCSQGEVETAKRLISDNFEIAKGDLQWALDKHLTLRALLDDGPNPNDPRRYFHYLLEGRLQEVFSDQDTSS